MHRLCLLLSCFSLLPLSARSPFVASSSSSASTTTCVVKGLYERVQPAYGTLATTMNGGDPEEVQYLYVPATRSTAMYDVTVTRKGANLYKVDGGQIFILTSYCYEYAYSQRAILEMGRKELVFR